MGINIQKQWFSQLILVTIIAMIVGLFLSRALLSISMIGFLLITCALKKFFLQVKTFLKTPVLVGISLLFFIPLISGLWSNDINEWKDVIRIKLPLLFFPIAFAGGWQLNEKQWRMIGLIFLLCVFLGCCWSLLQYLQDIQTINRSYLKAKSIPTPLDNDHVRFSLLVTIAVILSMFFLLKKEIKTLRFALIFLISFFIIYLHILSARTGLFSLYIFLFMLAVYWLYKKRNSKQSILITTLIIVLPVTAYLILPTFQNRIKYIFYDLSFAKSSTYLPGANDGNRLLSIKAGWSILKENPLGVGAGDLTSATHKWYDNNVEGMLPTDKFKPSSEWLMYGVTAGWPGFIVFTLAMLIPLALKKIRYRFFWLSINIVAAFSFIFDIGLEVQYGVFIYTFMVLWWYKWFKEVE